MNGNGLDERLAVLGRQAREWSADFRVAARALDQDPDRIKDFLDLPGVRCLGTFGIPPGYAEPLAVGAHRYTGTTALERAVLTENLARGDVGMVLASPGVSMSGVLMEQLGDQEQRDRFYSAVAASPTWTAFALTEPDRGSDASAITTALRPAEDGGLLLAGQKRYIGNACRARFASVLARTRPGPLGVTAVLVDAESPGFRATPLPTLGLRGAQLSAVELDGVEVEPWQVLGRHLSPARRGIWSCVQVFNRLRPTVAALALGVAAAAHAYVAERRPSATGADRDRIEDLGLRICATRALVHRAAAEVDATGRGRVASAAKARACDLAEHATLAACDLLGPAARANHPELDRLVRDARGVEFMEGTRNIQHLNLFQGLLSGELDAGGR
ncbi:acyl-CoA dehydrogenase family protein [Streptomyces olivaceus]|uniref:acyl-CoA dehydrogenase family protein n=1 Tax=Streptomyces olivaceus TaxID=47716 RepID=UPI001CCEE1CE|nr:acyl-CoA dehydrogenase family protein [Streptomyces olivaceus]MBZ6137241.1 acyl-CoA/acyl-ACP dehydrogenase [Streptomyces olivaceus]MBZ6165442.1 acyl-CoA/acyl-ACP dehydrogenase [Streptomyces olivaceus]